ncbi:alpha/beta-hydrolase [Aulographum hederae CBS 113979]|uniref:Carboxylic ester hydrolase n=1 Tax=Aulographum hederae CBS 113979 TaxID=1176131 RepID=A0A6G1GVE8_9PEZI|nr:alpha/beta-hydrolase [Aulographum hederae CBS 113979]
MKPTDDCLYANVWTKGPSPDGKKKPVMLWVFGGGFSLGDASMYDMANFVETQDVVAASFNYRTNIFGFPGAPDMPDYNVGLLDQRMGVEWVRDNIEAFGGDPDRIMLFGESAGGSSVDYYAYAWEKDPIVNAFAAQSGTVQMSGPFAPADDRTEAWFQVSSKLGCGGREAGGPATVKCMQGKTPSQVLEAIPTFAGIQAIVGSFGPTYDGKLVTRDFDKRALAGDFIKRPYLIGSNQNESQLFVQAFGPVAPSASRGVSDGFNCGAAKAAYARSKNNVPVWRYHYSGTARGQVNGSTHASDVLALFFTDGKAGVGKTFQDAWGAFARDPENGLKELGWPMYDPKGDTLVRIANDGSEGVDFVKADMYDYDCSTLFAGYMTGAEKREEHSQSGVARKVSRAARREYKRSSFVA